MKRYWPILVILLFIGALLYYSTIVIEQNKKAKEVIPIKAELVLYSDIPQNVMSVLTQEYEKKHHVRVISLPQTEEQMAERLSKKGEPLQADMIFTSQDNLMLAQREGRLQNVVTEGADLVFDQFKQIDGSWVGVWYDPVVFVQNDKFFNKEGKTITTWDALMRPGSWRLVMTDFVAARAAANMLYNFVEIYGVPQGMSIFVQLKPHTTQYSKFLATPVRLVYMDSADVAVANYSDGAQAIEDKHSVKLIYPQDGSPYYLTGVAVLKETNKLEETRAFINWLLSVDTKALLDKEKIFYHYTNPAIPFAKDSLGNAVQLLPIVGGYTEDGKKVLLNMWIEQVRFRKDGV